MKEKLRRKQVVRDVQLMMTDILATRSQQLSLMDAADIASSARSDDTSWTSTTESSSFSEPESESNCSSCSSSVQSSVALHSGSNHPT